LVSIDEEENSYKTLLIGWLMLKSIRCKYMNNMGSEHNDDH